MVLFQSLNDQRITLDISSYWKSYEFLYQEEFRENLIKRMDLAGEAKSDNDLTLTMINESSGIHWVLE